MCVVSWVTVSFQTHQLNEEPWLSAGVVTCTADGTKPAMNNRCHCHCLEFELSSLSLSPSHAITIPSLLPPATFLSSSSFFFFQSLITLALQSKILPPMVEEWEGPRQPRNRKKPSHAWWAPPQLEASSALPPHLSLSPPCCSSQELVLCDISFTHHISWVARRFSDSDAFALKPTPFSTSTHSLS